MTNDESLPDSVSNLPVENDGLCLDLPVLDVDLVSGEDDGDVFAHSDQISVPVGDVLVGHSGGYVEHDDGTLACREKKEKQISTVVKIKRDKGERSNLKVLYKNAYFVNESTTGRRFQLR